VSDERKGELRTLLRRTYERARELPMQAQLQECIDQLENPEVLVSEFVESYCAVEAGVGLSSPIGSAPAASDGEEELGLEYFYADREISVVGARPFAFTCVGCDVAPLRGMQQGGQQRDGLDYVALLRAPASGPALGAVQSALDATPFLVLLRLLACAAELAPKPQYQRLDREFFIGRLGPEPVFDLHLVLWEDGADAGPLPLYELTRDLAEMVKQAALDDPLFPPVLGDICALRMDPDAFEGMLRLDWRV
jgi:hypothetical protein